MTMYMVSFVFYLNQECQCVKQQSADNSQSITQHTQTNVHYSHFQKLKTEKKMF